MMTRRKSTAFLAKVTRLSPPPFLRREPGNEATSAYMYVRLQNLASNVIPLALKNVGTCDLSFTLQQITGTAMYVHFF